MTHRQRITVDVKEKDGWHLRAVIHDESDEDAASETEAWANEQFDICDLLDSITEGATVELNLNGHRSILTGEQFWQRHYPAKITNSAQIQVLFEDVTSTEA